MQMLLLVLGLVAYPPATSPPPAFQIGFCPRGEPGRVAYVRQFFASELTRSFREEYGLLAISPDDIRLLTDARDADACRRISQAVTLNQNGPYPRVWQGFKAGDFYVMSVTMDVPPGIFYHAGGTGLIILDSSFEVVATAS